LWCCTTSTILAQGAPVILDSILESTDSLVLEPQAGEQTKAVLQAPIFRAPKYDAEKQMYAISDVPSPRGENISGYISDPKDYLDVVVERRINTLLYELEQKSSVETAVVLLPSIGQEVPKDFAVALFNSWKIGKSDTDNGLLILTVMDQRRTEFEVGYGLEPILTDVVCFRIGVNEIVPSFKAGAYGLGIENAVLRVKEFMANPDAIDEVYGFGVDYEEPAIDWGWLHLIVSIYALLCVIFGFRFFGQAYDIQRSKDEYYDKYHRLDRLKFGCAQVLFPLPMFFFSRIAKRRLKHYRFAPRFSKKNGRPMALLTNYDEIDYLREAQLLEEEIRTILYDVWVTDDKSDFMILEYKGPNGRNYTNCSECGYKSFGKNKSYVSKPPTFYEEGQRIDYYVCRNCNYVEEEFAVIAMIGSSSSSSSGSLHSSSNSSSSSSFGGGSSGGGGAGVSW